MKKRKTKYSQCLKENILARKQATILEKAKTLSELKPLSLENVPSKMFYKFQLIPNVTSNNDECPLIEENYYLFCMCFQVGVIFDKFSKLHMYFRSEYAWKT